MKAWGWLAGIALLAVFAPFLTPDPRAQDLGSALLPPLSSLTHLLGTDALGRDVLSLTLHGLRVSLLVGITSSLIGATIGIPLGLLAGYSGGWLERLVMRAVDVGLSLPGLLVALVVLAMWGAGTEKLIVVLGVTSWAGFARLARAGALSQRSLEHVLAAQALGAATGRIIAKHVLPGIAGALIVKFTLEIPANMLSEAALSFLGLGAGVDTPSLGSSIALGYGRLYSGQWWLSILPGAALTLLVLSVNTCGENLRVHLDPRQKHASRDG